MSLSGAKAKNFLIGQSFSLFGDAMLLLAVGIWVKELTGSSASAALTYFFLAVPSFAAPLAGSLVDRTHRQTLLVSVNITLAASLLPMLLVRGPTEVWVIYLTMTIYGAGIIIIGTGQSALLATIIDPDRLRTVNGALSAARYGFRVAAPLIGVGIFVTFGIKAVVITDCATFIIAAAAVASIEVIDPVSGLSGHPSWRKHLGEGVRYIFSRRDIRTLIFACAIGTSVLGLVEAIVFQSAAGMRRPTSFVGVMVTAQGFGAVLGSVTAPTAIRVWGEAVVSAVGLFIAGSGWLSITTAESLPSLIGLTISGLGTAWVGIALGTYIQRTVPNRLIGRVDSIAEAAISMPQTIYIAVGAGLVTIISYKLITLFMSAIMVASSLWLVRSGLTRPIRLDKA